MALTETPPDTAADTLVADRASVDDQTEARHPSEVTAVEKVIGAGDHRTIGRVFIGCSLFFLFLGLVATFLTHLDLASEQSVLSTSLALRLGLNHQIGLLLLGVLPLTLGLAIAVVPPQVGSPAVAFPRAAALSLWGWLLTSVLFLVCVAADGSYGGAKVELARLGNVAVGGLIISLLIGVACVMVTVLTHRPMGMDLAQVPHFAFSMVVAGTLWLTTLPAAFAKVVFFHIQHPNPATLAEAGFTEGIGWLLHQPSVYLVAIPALGIAADSVVVMAGGRNRLHSVVQVGIGLTGLLAFGAWAQTPEARATAVWVTMAVFAGLPVLAVLGALADTLRRGSPRIGSPLGFALASILLLLLGAMTGLLSAIDSAGHGELRGFVDGTFAQVPVGMSVGQLYAVVGAALLAGLGGCFLWAGRLWGSALPDGAGKGFAAIAFAGVTLLAGSHLVLGLVKPSESSIPIYAGIAAAGIALEAIAIVGTLAALLRTRAEGPGDDDPAPRWRGLTLEWLPEGEAAPTAVSGAYPLERDEKVEEPR